MSCTVDLWSVHLMCGGPPQDLWSGTQNWSNSTYVRRPVPIKCQPRSRASMPLDSPTNSPWTHRYVGQLQFLFPRKVVAHLAFLPSFLLLSRDDNYPTMGWHHAARLLGRESAASGGAHRGKLSAGPYREDWFAANSCLVVHRSSSYVWFICRVEIEEKAAHDFQARENFKQIMEGVSIAPCLNNLGPKSAEDGGLRQLRKLLCRSNGYLYGILHVV